MQRNNKKRCHLNQEERIETYTLRKQGISLREIGRILKRPHSTISKELERNSEYLGWGKYRYDPLEANKKAKERRVKTKNAKAVGREIYSRSGKSRDRGDYREDEERVNRDGMY